MTLITLLIYMVGAIFASIISHILFDFFIPPAKKQIPTMLGVIISATILSWVFIAIVLLFAITSSIYYGLTRIFEYSFKIPDLWNKEEVPGKKIDPKFNPDTKMEKEEDQDVAEIIRNHY